MPELYAEQLGLTLLDVFLIASGIGLAPPLLIRFVLVRRPIGKGWAIAVAALFWAVDFVLFSALGGQSRTYGAFFLIAIISYLILTAGKKDKAPVIDAAKSTGMKAAAPDSGATGQNLENNREDILPVGYLLIDDADLVTEREATDLEVPRSKEPDPSNAEDDAELHRYDIAWRELESGNPHRGLWARAFAMNQGDDTKAKVQYLIERTNFLKEQERRQEIERRTRELRQQEIWKEKERQRKERMELLEKEEQRKEEERNAQEIREKELQKEKDRLRRERAEKLNREMQRQEEERQHQNLLDQIALKHSEKVSLLRDGINKPDKWNEFKLISAAQLESDENVFVLLAAGANPLLKDGFGYTARDYAEHKGRTEIARQLAIAERLWKQKSRSIRSNAA